MSPEQFEQNRQESEPIQPEVLETASEQELLIISFRLEEPPYIDRLSELSNPEEFKKLALKERGLL